MFVTPEFIMPDWDAPDNVHAVCTTRIGGVSQDSWHSLNLADHVDDNLAHVQQNREILRQRLSLPAEPVWLKQVHGCEIIIADHHSSVECDASMTHETGVVCAALTADCMPLLLCHQSGKVVAAVHAGWRGLASGVIEKTVLAMNAPANEILAWMGPAIGPQVFEVGAEVRDVFMRHDEQAEQAFHIRDEEHWLCDLYQLARQRLASIGVTEISGGGHCTYRESDSFFSYRRDGVTGRMASLIWIK